MGCVTSGVDVQVVRLTYKGGRGEARQLGPSDIAPLTRDGLIRSTHAFEAIFHDAAIAKRRSTTTPSGLARRTVERRFNASSSTTAMGR